MRCTVAAAAVIVALSGGCNKKDEEKKPSTGASGETATERGGKTGDRPVSDRRKLGQVGARRDGAERVAALKMLPISVDEVKSTVPALKDARPLGPPTQAMGGRQVRVTQCVRGHTTKEVAADLSSAFGKQGFTNVRTKAHPRDPNVILISAEKLPLRAGGSIGRGDFADCPEKNGETKVSLSYFKRATGEEASAPAKPDGSRPDEP